MGRPRKWESEAERKRAYRERLAADLAEPERLRRELRNARRRVAERDRRLAQVEGDLARAEAEIERRSKREIELEGKVTRLEAKVDDWRSRANGLSRNLEAERAKGALSSTLPPASGARASRPVAPTKRTTPKKSKRRKRR
jgi:predicted RNase H-like nuclease (RuvC/YqgF family)